jgi:hypothetical protein
MTTYRPRAIALTDAGLRAIGVSPTVGVPLLELPWRDERRDRKRGGPIRVHVAPPDLDAARAEGYHAGLRDARR